MLNDLTPDLAMRVNSISRVGAGFEKSDFLTLNSEPLKRQKYKCRILGTNSHLKMVFRVFPRLKFFLVFEIWSISWSKVIFFLLYHVYRLFPV